METKDTGQPDVVTSCQDISQAGNTQLEKSRMPGSYMDTIQQAAKTLRLHTEAEVLVSSLIALRESLEEYHSLDANVLKLLEGKRIHEDILICMHNFNSMEDIQTASCELLSCLMKLSSRIIQDLINKDAYQRIQRILDDHLSDVNVQIAALKTLSYFVQSQHVRRKVLYGGGDIVGHITRAMTAFPESPELQSIACRLLTILLSDDSTLQDELLKNRDYRLVLTALTRYSGNRDVAREACIFLHVLTNEASIFLTVLDGTLQSLIHDKVHLDMLKISRQHSKCEDTLAAAYGVLSILCFEEDVLHAIASPALELDLLAALMKFLRNADVQCHCFTIFANILSYDDELSYNRQDEQEIQWLKQVYIAMTQHRDAPYVQVACCRVLAELLELYPELTRNIGEDLDNSEDPLHILCFGALLMHHGEPAVVVAACTAIYWLSADNQRIQQHLMQKNAHIAVIHAMKLHPTDPSAQAAACRALRGLAIFSQENKETISWHGDLSDIFRPLQQFPNHLDVQIESIAVLACLADTELVRTVSFVDQLHKRILAAMDNHEASPLLHEVALEALGILCAADGGATVLNDTGAITTMISSIKTHWNNPVIQRKGLVLLQLLLEDIDASQVVDHSDELAAVVCSAMSEHRDEVGLQTEACVAMLILAEKGEIPSIQLVDANAHGELFYILEYFQDHRNLVEIANECLFVLGCERNLKSQMLQYACAQGLTKGVECLIQLGAEVNVGSGTETPLCHACQHGNEHIVGLLLRQGATDLQTALHLTLRLEMHNLAGLILSHCDRHGGIVSWNGLGLAGLRPEWMEPTFLGGSSRPWQVSESGKQMAERIKKTEERRSHRHTIQRNLSAPASALSSSRRVSLRYSFQTKQRFGNKEELVQKLQENYPQDDSIAKGSSENQVKKVASKSGPLARLKRKIQAMKNRRKSSPAFMSLDKEQRSRSRSELIRSISTSTFSLYEQERQGETSVTEHSIEFSHSPDEYREWRETTLTGSNVPYSSLDPRVSEERTTLDDFPSQPLTTSGAWQRKSPFRKARRRSESFLEIYKLSRRASSLGSLRSMSVTYQQGIQSDETSQDSHVSALSTELFTEHLPPPLPVTPPPPPPSRLRKRATVSQINFHDIKTSSLSTIKDGQPNDQDIGSPLAESTLTGSTSNLLRLAEPAPAPVAARRARSVTYGDSPPASAAEKIEQLDLSSNSIKDLNELLTKAHPSLLCSFNNLEKLDLSQNQLKTIPDALFKFLSQLREINLQYNQLAHLPTGALGCRHLTIVDVSNNQIEGLNLVANRVTMSVKELNLSHNNLQTFPQGLSKTMPHLEVLNIYGNRINYLPEEALHLKYLRVLDLSHNHIRHIPDPFLSDFNVLESLVLSGNEIDNLPSEELASSLPRLAVIKVSHNQLTGKEPLFIPKLLLELQGLRSLDISHNQLSGLPEPCLWKTQLLREINASHNCISKINLNQARLWPALERLVLAHNELSEIPPDIGQLMSLTSLDIGHNEKLTTIPDEMGRLQKLWELSLDGLKLDIDEGLTRGRTKDLIGYLHEKLKRSVEYYHMKMMVVGYGGRGKSTLIRSLMRQKQPGKSMPTVGVVVRDWTFRGRSPRTGSGTVTYTISTWDFAGQEEFYSTHQCFLSNRALYLVIYNLSKGPSEVEMLRPWLVNIQARAPNCPVIVVGTHMDTLPRDWREDHINDMRRKISEMCEGPGFPDLKGILEVNSTQEGPAMDRLRMLVKDALDNFKVKGQHVMGQKIPESYVRLQDLLSEEAKNLRSSLPIIKHGRLTKIVKDAELDLDEEELQQAVRFLHETGALLHYDDAALQLNSLYFVDPEWLCRMMAQVVTVREINPFISPQGILKKQHVRLLFTGKRVGDQVHYTFPPSLIPQYLRLLEKFEIALPQNEEELLIPSRLPPERPVFKHPLPNVNHETDHTHCCMVQRCYGLSYTPIGFWPRLLTRLLVLLESSFPDLDLGKRRPEEVSYWKEGIYIYYSVNSFVLVSAEQGMSGMIVISVPGTRYGARLLGEVVDHVDTLMDEWYPGLLEISPTGQSLVTVSVPCPLCPESQKHVFTFDELISQSDLEDSIECPIHQGNVSLSILAPDVVLADMDERQFLKHNEFTFVQKPEFVLGEGTFGCVYRATYKKQAVAVKIFSKVGDDHPYKSMRQEATILRRLNHPSLVGLVGFGLRPRVIVLELAPLGALGSLLKTQRVKSRMLQHRIAVQVAEGLNFLHDHKIIYRDMKPDNILIYNLSLAVVINAKISDYGISRLATPAGLTQPEGTPGYRGPEVVKGEPYSVQADIYSFGITLYEMVTCGQHPFSELGFQSEVDDAVLRGRRVEPVTMKGAEPWPDMEDLIDRCLHPCPEDRPTSGQVLGTLSGVELLSLRRAVAVSKGVTVECMEVRGYGEGDLEVWVASGEKNEAQLSWLSLTHHNQEPKGMMFTGSRILCMEAIGKRNVLLGTQAGTINVYDALNHCSTDIIHSLPDSILCMKHYDGYHDQDLVMVGLANGQLAIYNTKDITSDSKGRPEFIEFGTNRDPLKVMHMDYRTELLYLATGATLHILNLYPNVHVKTSFDTVEPGGSRELVSQLIIQGKFAHVSKKGHSRVEMWHLNKHLLHRSVDIRDLMKGTGESDHYTRITSMVLVGKSTLWIGTGEGAIVLLDSGAYQHINTMLRHTGPIRSLLSARLFDQYSTVIAGGLGFVAETQSHNEVQSAGYDDHGYLTIWDPELPQHKRTLAETDARRQEWHVRHQRSIADQTSALEASSESVGSASGVPASSAQGHHTSAEVAPANVFKRRKSVEALFRVASSKIRQGVKPENASRPPLTRQEPSRRFSNILLHQFSDQTPISTKPSLSFASKRGSLTANLEYGRVKRASVHGLGLGNSPPEVPEEPSKRVSMPAMFDPIASFPPPKRSGSMEISNLMKMRKRKSSAGIVMVGSPRENLQYLASSPGSSSPGSVSPKGLGRRGRTEDIAEETPM